LWLQVRRVWAIILQFLMKNKSMKAPTWNPAKPWLPWQSAPDYETDPLLHMDPDTAGMLITNPAVVQISEVPTYKRSPNGDLQYGHPLPPSLTRFHRRRCIPVTCPCGLMSRC